MNETIANRIKAAGLNMDFFIKNALEITKSYAGSDNADSKAIPNVFTGTLLAMLEAFEGPEKK